MTIADNIEWIDPRIILVEKRQRSETKTEQLIDSIKKYNILIPLIVTHTQSEIGAPLEISLVDGRRRLACAIELNLALIPVRFFETLSESEMKTIELEANIKRENLPWNDRVRAIGGLHELKLSEDPYWTVDQTAELISYSRRQTSDILSVYNSIDIPAVATASTLTHAIGILTRIAERRSAAIVEDLLRAPSAVEPAVALERITQALVEDVLEISDEEILAEVREDGKDPTEIATRGRAILERAVVESAKVNNGPIITADFIPWISNYSGPKFNLIHCDFPQDDVVTFCNLIDALTNNLDRILSYSGHILLWYNFAWYETTKLKLHRVGLSVTERPLIWIKSDTRSASYTGRELQPKPSYETALLAYRGNRSLLCWNTDSYSAQTVASPIHPQQKPEPMLRHFLSMLVDNVTDFLDPTCGSGSAIRAAEDLGARNVVGLEVNAEYAAVASTATLRARSLRNANKESKGIVL